MGLPAGELISSELSCQLLHNSVLWLSPTQSQYGGGGGGTWKEVDGLLVTGGAELVIGGHRRMPEVDPVIFCLQQSYAVGQNYRQGNPAARNASR